MQEELPTWLQPGRLIDAKDKHGDWQVALIQRVIKNQIKVRFDGWQAKYDQNFYIHSPNIQPFRTIVRGYTGQIKSPGIREHFLFCLQESQEVYLDRLEQFLNDLQHMTADQITQFLRGHHYIWVDYLLTCQFTQIKHFQHVYHYFSRHIALNSLYFQHLIQVGIPEWFNNSLEHLKAFAQSHYQIFQSTFSILEGQHRHRQFFTTHTALLLQLDKTAQTNLKFWHKKMDQMGFFTKFQRIIQMIGEDESGVIPFSFIRSLCNLYLGVQKVMTDKDTKNKLCDSVCAIFIKHSLQITQQTVKICEKDLDQIYAKLKIVLMKYQNKAQVLEQMELARLNCWEKMIKTQSLQRKIRAIGSIRRYFDLLSSENKQVMMLYGEIADREKWLKEKNIIQLIFCQNEHHQIIKKGCELATTLYMNQFIGEEELTGIWHSSRGRLEAVRKIMYNFFQKIVKYATIPHLFKIVQLIQETEITDAYDVSFFYSFAEEVVENKKDDSTEIIHQVIKLAMRRAKKNPQQISKFSTLLVVNNQEIIKFYVEELILKIGDQQTTQFNLKVLIEVYSLSEVKQFEMDDFDSFAHVFSQLRKTLKNHPNRNHEQLEQIIDMLLKLLEFLQEQSDFPIQNFQEMWELFNQPENIGFRDKIFYGWILQSSPEGIFKIQGYSINRALRTVGFREQIFNQILKNSQNLDYINMTAKQFLIFRQFLLDVNQGQKKLTMNHHKFTGVSYFRTVTIQINGLTELWNIFLNCRNQEIVPKIVEFIKDIYLNCPDYNLNMSVTNEEKEKRINTLLLKLDRNIKSGLQKLNMKLITRSLLLLKEIIYEVMEYKKQPPQLHLSNNFPDSRRLVRWRYEDHDRERQMSNIEPLRNLKIIAEKQFGIKPYHMKVFKNSASMKMGDNNLPRTVPVEEQIPKEQLFLPLFTLIMGQQKFYFTIKKVTNPIYDLLVEFISTQMQQSLLKILSQSDQVSEENSYCAYKILITIPSKKNPLEITTNLISQHNSPQSLETQSVYYRLYLIKNINLIQKQHIKQFLSKGWVLQSILKQLIVPIKSLLDIQIIQEVVYVAYTSNKLMKIPLDSDDILHCIKNLLVFVGDSHHHNEQKEKKKIEVFGLLLVLLEGLNKKNSFQIFNSIIGSSHFTQIIHFLYKNKNIKRDYRNVFDGKISTYLKEIKKNHGPYLTEHTQPILFQIVLKDLYPYVCAPQNKCKNNNSFFRLLKQMITIISEDNLQKLCQVKEQWQGHQGHITFWDVCLNVVKRQSDVSPQENQQNSFFSGHLQTLQCLIYKNPTLIDTNLINFIFFDCLFYDNNYTTVQTIKCRSQRSIQGALSIIETLCYFHDKHLNLIVENLRKVQKIEYWRNLQKWGINLELQLKSETGYVGLDNPGCICYLNSFIQTLFMNKEFRRNVINYKQQKSNQFQNDGIQKPKKNVLGALKQLFMNLQFSDKKYLSPVDFSRTLRTMDNKPVVKIFQQMDIEEFSSILFDRIDNILPQDKNFVKDLYQGVFSNEIISQQCKHCSQRQQCFLSIQIDVKDSVEESLKTLVKGEMLQGQNAYYCERCDKKVKALKRVSIKKLPDHLIICLKRFEYNFQIDQKIKLNTYCQFSENFCLEEYSRQFLNNKKPKQQDNDNDNNENIQEQYPKQYFDYKLKGVIIHTGFADSGHYYSIEEVEPGKWMEFNDNFVTEFNIDKLPDQAYGSKDYHDSKVKNAYMLVYERKNKINKYQMEGEGKIAQIEDEDALKMYREIQETNKQIHAFELFFSSEYNHFVRNFIVQVSRFKQIPAFHNILKYIIQHTLLIRMRDNNLLLLIENLHFIEEHTLNCEDPLKDQIVDAFLEEMTQTDFIYQFFAQPPYRDRSMILARFLGQIIMKKIQKDGVLCHQKMLRVVCAFLEVMLTSEVIFSQGCYIMRKIMQTSDTFYKYYEELDISCLLFDILTGSRQTGDEKEQKINKLKQSVRDILKGLPKSHEDGEERDRLHIDRKNPKVNKNAAKNEYIEEIWYFMFKLFVKQEQIVEVGSKADQSQSQNEAESAEQLYKIATVHHDYILHSFQCLHQNRLTHFFESCTSAKSCTAFSYLLCEMTKNSDTRTQKILSVINHSLKSLQVNKFRPYLVALYHLCEINDQIDSYRFMLITKYLQEILGANKKYFSEVDILMQWIHKMCACIPQFVTEIQGTELVGQFIEVSQNHHKPTNDLMKKQKNPNYQRYNYRLHNLLVSIDPLDYEKWYHQRNFFFDQLFQKLYTCPLSKSLKEPSLTVMEKSYSPGDEISVFTEKEWVSGVVKEAKYGLLRLAIGGNVENIYRWENDDRVKQAETEELERCQMEEQEKMDQK